MEEATINKLRSVEYAALDFTAGLADLVISVRKPDGSILSPAPTVSEEGDGIYTFSYTPDAVGVWQEKIVSATNGDKAYRTVTVRSVDIEDVSSDVSTVDGKLDTVDGKVDSIEGKVDGIDTKSDTIISNIRPGGRFI